MRVLITGGAGFLGSHLCDRLLAEGHEVICIDNLRTGRKENIAGLLARRDFAFLQQDVTEPFFVEGKVDAVMHFASPASPKDYLEHPIHTLKVGGPGTYHALGLAKAQGAVFILASTSEVYGDPEVNPQPETYWGHVNPVGPRSVYDEAKRYAEAMTVAYQRAHGLRTRILRIFNTYGPRMRLNDGRALPTLMGQALRGDPLTVYGDGSQTRSFCYVSDLVEGIYRLLLISDPAPLLLNLGNPEEVTLRQLAQEILEISGSRSQVVFQPLPEDDPKRRRPDVHRAQQILGWAPRVARREGLQKTLAYFREALGG
ncbi:MAG: UDP-glucuronic acid decarboxylase family protein [Terriglobia bacterium]